MRTKIVYFNEFTGQHTGAIRIMQAAENQSVRKKAFEPVTA